MFRFHWTLLFCKDRVLRKPSKGGFLGNFLRSRSLDVKKHERDELKVESLLKDKKKEKKEKQAEVY